MRIVAAQADSGDMGETEFFWGLLPKASREGESILVPLHFPSTVPPKCLPLARPCWKTTAGEVWETQAAGYTSQQYGAGQSRAKARHGSNTVREG